MAEKHHHQTMRAAFWEGKVNQVAVHDAPRATLQLPGDVVVRVTTAAICGTDLHIFHGLFGGSNVPYTIGHEAVGVIVEAGDDVTQFKRGDRVVISAGSFTPLGGLDFHGAGNLAGNLGGCQAEFVRVPDADLNLFRIPSSPLSDADYVLLADIWPTAWSGLNFSGFEAGDSVAVFGAGPVGLLVAYSALLRGASRVFSVDYVPARLQLAQSIGAIPIDFTKSPSPADQIKAILPNGVNRVVDAYGYECVNARLQPQEDFILREAVKVAAPFGGIGVIGVYATEPVSQGAPRADTIPPSVSFPIADFWIKSLSMRAGAVDVRPLWPHLGALIESGRAKPSFVFSLEIGIERILYGFKRFNAREVIKVLIRFPWELEEEPIKHDRTETADHDDEERKVRSGGLVEYRNGHENGHGNGHDNPVLRNHLRASPHPLPHHHHHY